MACLALLWATPARAGLLGSTLSWQYYVAGGSYLGSQTFTVNGGVEGTFIDAGNTTYFNILADDSSITFDYSVTTSTGPWSPCGLSLAPTVHNGLALNVVSGPAFSSVTLDPASNMVGFDASRFSFTGSQIQVDWQNLSFDQNTIVKLDVITVPEPCAAALAGLGGAALMVLRRRSSQAKR